MTKRHWLDIAEYIAIAASVSGTLTSILTQQVIYVAAPLTITAGLNLVNRQRFTQSIQGQQQENITRLQQELSAITLSLPETRREIETFGDRLLEIQNQQSQLARDHQDQQGEITQDLNQLEDYLKQIQQQLEPLAKKYSQLEAIAQQINPEITDLKATLANVQSQNQESKNYLDSLHQQVTQLENLGQTIPTPIRQKLEELEGLITSLGSQNIPQRLAQIEQVFQSQPSWEIQQQTLKNELQQPLNVLEGRLGELEAINFKQHLETLRTAIAQIQQTPEGVTASVVLPDWQVEELKTNLDRLQQQFNTLTQDTLPGSQSQWEEKLINFQELIANLTQKQGDLQQQLRNFTGETTQAIQILQEAIEKEIAALQKVLNELKSPPVPTENNLKKDSTPELQKPPTVPPQYRRETVTSPGETDWEDEIDEIEEIPPYTSSKESVQNPKLGVEMDDGLQKIGDNILEIGSSLRNLWGRFLTPETEELNSSGWLCQDTFYSNADGVETLALSNNGQWLASPKEDGEIQLWNLGTGEIIKTLMGESGQGRKNKGNHISTLAFSPDGQKLVSGGEDFNLKLWDLTTDTVIYSLKGHVDRLATVAYSPHQQTIASGGYDKTIKLWDVSSGQELRSLRSHWEPVLTVAFSPDSKTLVSGSSDGTIKFWDVPTGEKLANVPIGTAIQAVAISPNGKILAYGGGDRRLKLLDLETQTEIRNFRLFHPIYSIAFSPDSQTLVCGTSGKSITLWDVKTGRKIAVLEGHQGRVNTVVFSPLGDSIVSGSSDGTIKIWHTDN